MTKESNPSINTTKALIRQRQSSVGGDKDPRAELGLIPPNDQSDTISGQRDRVKFQEDKATQFDGNPNPTAVPNGVFKPKDDTPFLLKKTKGPRQDQ